MGGLIAAVVILALALIGLLIVHLRQRRRIGKLAEQMEAFLVSGSDPLKFSVQEDALAPLQNAAANWKTRCCWHGNRRRKSAALPVI